MYDLFQGYFYLMVYKDLFGLNLKAEIWGEVVDLGEQAVSRNYPTSQDRNGYMLCFLVWFNLLIYHHR